MQREQCKVKNFSKYCLSEHIENIVFRSNTRNSILIKSTFLEETEFVVWIKFHFISIYKYNNVNKNLIRVKGLYTILYKVNIETIIGNSNIFNEIYRLTYSKNNRRLCRANV